MPFPQQRRRDHDSAASCHSYGSRLNATRNNSNATSNNSGNNNKNNSSSSNGMALGQRKQKKEDDRMTCTSGIVPRAKIKTIKMTFVFVSSKSSVLILSNQSINHLI